MATENKKQLVPAKASAGKDIILDASNIVDKKTGMTEATRKFIEKSKTEPTISKDDIEKVKETLAKYAEQLNPMQAALVGQGNEFVKKSVEEIIKMGEVVYELLGTPDKPGKLPDGIRVENYWKDAGFSISYSTATNYKNLFIAQNVVLADRAGFLKARPNDVYPLKQAYLVARAAATKGRSSKKKTQAAQEEAIQLPSLVPNQCHPFS